MVTSEEEGETLTMRPFRVTIYSITPYEASSASNNVPSASASAPGRRIGCSVQSTIWALASFRLILGFHSTLVSGRASFSVPLDCPADRTLVDVVKDTQKLLDDVPT